MDDRRRYQRVEESAVIKFRYQSEEDYRFGLLLDLSGGGMKLLLDQEPKADEPMILRATIPHEGNIFEFSSVCKIAWQRRTGGSQPGFLAGVSFEQINESDRRVILDYVESRRRPSLIFS